MFTPFGCFGIGGIGGIGDIVSRPGRQRWLAGRLGVARCEIESYDDGAHGVIGSPYEENRATVGDGRDWQIVRTETVQNSPRAALPLPLEPAQEVLEPSILDSSHRRFQPESRLGLRSILSTLDGRGPSRWPAGEVN
jgi:hypothetical protein